MARNSNPSSEEFASVFEKLRTILEQHAGSYSVTDDTAKRYCLEAAPGPATIKAWRGERRAPTIPVASVEVRKSYVSYHLMGLYVNAAMGKKMSKALSARQQGKSCLNFTRDDPALFEELKRVTAESLTGMKKAGFI